MIFGECADDVKYAGVCFAFCDDALLEFVSNACVIGECVFGVLRLPCVGRVRAVRAATAEHVPRDGGDEYFVCVVNDCQRCAETADSLLDAFVSGPSDVPWQVPPPPLPNFTAGAVVSSDVVYRVLMLPSRSRTNTVPGVLATLARVSHSSALFFTFGIHPGIVRSATLQP